MISTTFRLGKNSAPYREIQNSQFWLMWLMWLRDFVPSTENPSGKQIGHRVAGPSGERRTYPRRHDGWELDAPNVLKLLRLTVVNFM